MDDRQPERYQPLALIGVTLIALLGFAVFFLSFLVAPLAILLIFYVGFAASDRTRRTQGRREAEPAADAAPAPAAEPEPGRATGSAALLARARQQRRQTIERSDAQEER
ncbi:MAG TPA: hypothetical protein VFR97_00405 [Capillimicrobium sp.]|nr:hypothetical protein [Capillimicrobium sp.]